MKWFSEFLDGISEYLAHRKGLLPMIGLGFIMLNLFLNLAAYIIPMPEWLILPNIFLHIGLIIAIVGLMLAWAL